jgi:flagellar biosynthetic protein FlhB
VCAATLDLGLRVGLLLALIAAADYLYQHWQYERDLRMSKDEVKEEQKLLEGNPEVEARIRRMQITLSRSRMLRNVKKADVVVRNPTHYAVALKYDPAKAAAPIVLAKGADYLAMRIVELAREHRVHTVHDAPLAQALYKTVEVGEVIPAKLYRAVARLLLHVYKLRGQNPPGAR